MSIKGLINSQAGSEGLTQDLISILREMESWRAHVPGQKDLGPTCIRPSCPQSRTSGMISLTEQQTSSKQRGAGSCLPAFLKHETKPSKLECPASVVGWFHAHGEEPLLGTDSHRTLPRACSHVGIGRAFPAQAGCPPPDTAEDGGLGSG